MPEDSDDDLDHLSSKELHDLAVAYARQHHDVRFLVRLMETLPAAEAAAGEVDKMEADVIEIGAHIDDVTDSGRDTTPRAATVSAPSAERTAGVARRAARLPSSKCRRLYLGHEAILRSGRMSRHDSR